MSFFFNDTATTEIYTLSLHDALPISPSPQEIWGTSRNRSRPPPPQKAPPIPARGPQEKALDRKSTRLNSSHANISYAVFCLKKKKSPQQQLYSLFPPTILTSTHQSSP